MKILIAVDDSDFAQRLVDYAITHPELLGLKPDVTLITAVPAIAPRAAAYFSREEMTQYCDEDAEKALAPAREALARGGIAARSLYCTGHPATTIAEHASSGGYDLLLMGSHGHSAIANLVLGSVVSGVLARCSTPVLIVR